MNLLSAAERLAALDRSRVILHTESCLHSLGRFSTCQACAAICPAEAIQAGRPPVLEAEKCQRCLACLPVCPAGAFQAEDAIPNLLNCAARLETGSIELLCERHPRPERGLREGSVGIRLKGCLAGIGSSGYFALLALGPGEVIAHLDACAGCPWGALQAQIEDQIASAQKLLSAWGRAGALRASQAWETQTLVERPLWEADNPPLSRRDLFRLASLQGQVAAARFLSADQPREGKRLPRQRQRLLAAIHHLPAPAGSAGLSLEGLGFVVLSVSEACTACGVCARLCPTGALQYSQEDRHYQLSFDPAACTGCGACASVCEPDAIDLQAVTRFEQVFGSQGTPVSLVSGELIRCQNCRTLYDARLGEPLCPACKYRRNNPFGSKLPPGFKGNLRN